MCVSLLDGLAVLEKSIDNFDIASLGQNHLDFYNNPLILGSITLENVPKLEIVFREMTLSAKERRLSSSSVSSNIKGPLSSWVIYFHFFEFTIDRWYLNSFAGIKDSIFSTKNLQFKLLFFDSRTIYSRTCTTVLEENDLVLFLLISML